MEREIGEKFKLNLTIKVVESDSPYEGCKGCIFYNYDICILMSKELGYCSEDYRSDGKHVHFEIDNDIL